MRATKRNLMVISFITLGFLVLQKQGFGIPFLGNTVVDKDKSTATI